MGDIGASSTDSLDPRPTIKPSAGSTQQTSRAPPLPPTLAQEPPDRLDGWKTIGEQQEFYDEKDFLYPSHNLTSEKLKDRKEDDVVIFDYSLCHEDGSPPVERGGPSLEGFGKDDDRFFQVSKDRLIDSEQFNQVISPTGEPGLIQSRARLGIM